MYILSGKLMKTHQKSIIHLMQRIAFLWDTICLIKYKQKRGPVFKTITLGHYENEHLFEIVVLFTYSKIWLDRQYLNPLGG